MTLVAEGLIIKLQRKKDGKDQESIQSSSTPDPGYHMGKLELTGNKFLQLMENKHLIG